MSNDIQPDKNGKLPDGTYVPKSFDPGKCTLLYLSLFLAKLPWFKQRLLNNTMAHIKVTPTFWCASNLLTLNMMIFLAVGYFLYFEANKLEDFEIRYDDVCSSYRGKN